MNEPVSAEASTCPTCGAAVRVVSGDEGTSSYQPVAEADNAALLKALRKVDRLAKCLHGGYGRRYPPLDVSSEDFLAVTKAVLCTPHPGQPLLDRLNKAEAGAATLSRAFLDRLQELEADNMVLTDLCRRIADAKGSENLGVVQEWCGAVLSTPHPGQPLLDRLERVEAVVAAVRGSHYCARVPAVAVALAALKEAKSS